MEKLESGRIRVHFMDGDSAECDFLVAADGINSAIRKQLLPKSFEPTKYGTAGIAGKVFLDSPDMIEIGQLQRGVCIVMSTNGRGIFVAPQIYTAEAKEKIRTLFSEDVDGVTHETQLSPNSTGDNLLLLGGDTKGKLVDDARDYVFYGYLSKHPERDFGIKPDGSMKDVSQQDLLNAALTHMDGDKWAPSLKELVKKTDVNTVGYWPLQVSPKVTSLSGYKPSNVTFLGDSIHGSTFF
jgi:hypothetical protein